MKYTVRTGCWYRATIQLSGMERFASNNTVARKLADAGFSMVTVVGSGKLRQAKGFWAKAPATAPVPRQVVKVEEI